MNPPTAKNSTPPRGGVGQSDGKYYDPWGNTYKYLQQPSRYLVIGFTPDGKADTDLFLSRGIDTGATASAPTKQQRGGITLID